MEDNGMRVIFFAVSILVTMATFSLVMLYYNSAKTIADSIGDRTDIGVAYDAIITDKDRIRQEMTGVEIRQLIRKYAGDTNVEMNIISISDMKNSDYMEDIKSKGLNENINNTWLNPTTGNIQENYLSIIDPGWEINKIKKEVNGEKIKLQLCLDNSADWLCD